MNLKKLLTTILAATLVLSLGQGGVVFAEEIEPETEPVVSVPKPTVPTQNVYRLYNRATKEHLYTARISEVGDLARIEGWKNEGVAWQAPNKGTPVYRIFNPKIDYHLYTTDENETQYLIENEGWKMDNGGRPVFYSGGDVPVTRWYQKDVGRHVLTVVDKEAKNLERAGWIREPGFMAVSTYSNAKIETVEIDRTQKRYTIQNVPGEYAIEGAIRLDGSGSGYHGKYVIGNAVSAISFGLQHDEYAAEPYTGKTMFLLENVHSNEAGHQIYKRYNEASLKEYYKVMMAVHKDGTFVIYLDGYEIDRGHNPGLEGCNDIYMQCEGSARNNGDTVCADFKDARFKSNGYYSYTNAWHFYTHDNNKGIEPQFYSVAGGRISGIIKDLKPGQDWDTNYNDCSGRVSFYDLEK